MTCEKCGKEIVISDFPFCPHGTTQLVAIGDDIPGGQVIETIAHEPMTFYSKKAIVAAADAHGLRPTDRFPSWRGVIDAKTLDNARALVSRQSRTINTVTCETASFTVLELKTCS